MQDADHWVMKSIAKILIRNGVISQDEIMQEVDDLERHGLDEASRALFVLALEAESMSAAEYEADFRRRQIVERTAYIAKRSEGYKPDE
jgi:hypothetical protein